MYKLVGNNLLIGNFGTTGSYPDSVSNEPVFIKEGFHFAVSFHPELTADTTIHEMFLESIIK